MENKSRVRYRSLSLYLYILQLAVWNKRDDSTKSLGPTMNQKIHGGGGGKIAEDSKWHTGAGEVVGRYQPANANEFFSPSDCHRSNNGWCRCVPGCPPWPARGVTQCYQILHTGCNCCCQLRLLPPKSEKHLLLPPRFQFKSPVFLTLSVIMQTDYRKSRR